MVLDGCGSSCDLVIGLWAVAEPLRLYTGYHGNLLEKPLSLAAFLLLSLCPQAVIMLLLVISQVWVAFEELTFASLQSC